MALKFLNKKGWHTGSLRNIETVWKAEQKHEGEQKKLEELRKQIHDEREKSEFRLMQEQAGLVPKQERLEFLYDSGLQVGKVAQADEYLLGKPVEEAVQPESEVGQVAEKPGALFVEEKPASANDSWRKLHSDPLFLIRQQEQAAIAKIKSNPVKMAEIKKAAEMKKKLKEEKKKKRKEAKRERREKKKRKKLRSSSTEDSSDSDTPRKSRKHGHESDADVDAGHRRMSRRSPSKSPTRSPVRKDRSQSPRKSRADDRNAFKVQGSEQEHRSNDLRLKGFDSRESERRKRGPSRSPSRSPVRRDHDWDRARRDGAFEREGRASERNGSVVRSETRKRAASRSISRSPVRRDHGRNAARRGDARSASQGSRREHTMLREPDDRDYDKGKRALPRSPSKSPNGSPIRRTSASRSSPVRRDRDQLLKRSEDRGYDKRKRVPSRGPSVSRSRSPVRRSPVRRDHDEGRSRRDDLDSRSEGRELSQKGTRATEDQDYGKRKRAPSRSPVGRSRSPVRRSPVRRDHDEGRSRRNELDSRGEGRELRQKGTKASEDRDYERRKRAPSRSLSRSLSRSPVGRRNYGQSRLRRADLDSRSAPRSEGRYREHSSRSDHQDSRPHDTREQERRPRSPNNGVDLRSNDPVVGGEKLDAEVDVARGNGNSGAVPPRPMNRGRPPKPGQLSDAERAARLAEMQANADVHEEQRWQRLKRAADADAGEVKRSANDKTNEEFLVETQKSIFGSERANASTIEKSVKRRAHFIERSSADNERNAFRR